MGAGQIGGIATLLDMDFKNAATFLGQPAESTEAQYVVHYLSHAMMFCLGVLIEAHVVLTPASCVHGERYKFNVVAGTHKFLENTGALRLVNHLCVHRGYNTSQRWSDCLTDNLALLVLSEQFSFHTHEVGAEFIMNRVRYGISAPKDESVYTDTSCKYFGWGSRRNGYLIPLLIQLRRKDVVILPRSKCLAMFNYQEKFLCIHQSQCRDLKGTKYLPSIMKDGSLFLTSTFGLEDFYQLNPYSGRPNSLAYLESEKFGALCPDDVGSVIVCSGFARGMMISRLVDRPCGVGFLDLSKYSKFLTCGVDDSRDVIGSDDDGLVEFASQTPPTPVVRTLPPENSTSDESWQESAPQEVPTPEPEVEKTPESLTTTPSPAA